MSFRKLYNHRQKLAFRLKRNHLCKLAQDYSGREALILGTDGITYDVVRGMYLSVDAPGRPEYEWAINKALIIVSYSNNYCWKRMVVYKESMHLFDVPQEAVSTETDFETLLEDLVAVAPTPRSRAMNAEIRALWRGLTLFIPEVDRAALAQKRTNGDITDDAIAKKVRMPLQFVPSLFGPHYRTYLEISLLEEAP